MCAEVSPNEVENKNTISVKEKELDEKMAKIRAQNELIAKRYQEVEEDRRNANELSKLAVKDFSGTSNRVSHKRSLKPQIEIRHVAGGRLSSESDCPPADPKNRLYDDPLRSDTDKGHSNSGHVAAFEPSKSQQRQRRISNEDSLQRSPNQRAANHASPGKFHREHDHHRHGHSNTDYEQWKKERALIDQQRLQRAQTSSGQWKREWDLEKGSSSANDDSPVHDQFGTYKREANSAQASLPQNGGSYRGRSGGPELHSRTAPQRRIFATPEEKECDAFSPRPAVGKAGFRAGGGSDVQNKSAVASNAASADYKPKGGFGQSTTGGDRALPAKGGFGQSTARDRAIPTKGGSSGAFGSRGTGNNTSQEVLRETDIIAEPKHDLNSKLTGFSDSHTTATEIVPCGWDSPPPPSNASDDTHDRPSSKEELQKQRTCDLQATCEGNDADGDEDLFLDAQSRRESKVDQQSDPPSEMLDSFVSTTDETMDKIEREMVEKLDENIRAVEKSFEDDDEELELLTSSAAAGSLLSTTANNLKTLSDDKLVQDLVNEEVADWLEDLLLSLDSDELS